MTVINTNTGSLYAQQAMNTNARALASVTQQLSTGKRINNSVDDVAGMAISTRLTSQIRGLNQAVRNANDGISLIQTAEGATEQVTNMLQRMRELAVQSSNDTNNSNDRSFLDKELQQLKLEINRIASTTQWNGANILDGMGGHAETDSIRYQVGANIIDGTVALKADGTFIFQVGGNSNQTISVKLPSLLAFSEHVIPEQAGTATTNVFDFANENMGNLTSPEAQKNVGRTYTISTQNGNYISYTLTQKDIDGVDGAHRTIGEAVAEGLKNNYVEKYGVSIQNDDLDTQVATAVGTTFTLTTSGSGAHKIPDLIAKVVGGKLSAIENTDITSQANAGSGLQAIDSALQAVNAERANMGAVISRLQFASDNLANVSTKAQESRSRIEDTDYSQATTELAKRNIIQQAAQAMLAQANQAPQLVLQLLK